MYYSKLLILSWSLLMVCSGYSQPTMTGLLETPLLKTEKETKAFLQSVTHGKQPQMQYDGEYRSYSLEGPSFHIEYKIDKDTCVMAGIRFSSNTALCNSFLREVMVSTVCRQNKPSVLYANRMN